MRWRLWLASLFLIGLTGPVAVGADWLHWRGPLQTGFATDKDLPDEWDPSVPGKNNLVWKAPYGCRTAPLVMGGKLFVTSAVGDTPFVPNAQQKLVTGEQVVCLDAKTGKLVWEKPFNVFHTDIVTNRLGWAPLAGDPENGRVYAHTTAGFLVCFDAKDGKILWQRQLTEEYGRITGYGGRVGGGPIFDSGLIIVGIVNSSWGDFGPGANRFVAFDGATGKVVWWGSCPTPIKGTYYSNPVVAVINGERLLITGAADGSLYAFQVRTGKLVWSHLCSAGVINGSPVVSGNLVYVNHGEENPEGGSSGLGRIVCVDASKITAGKPALVWEFRKGIRFGLASPALADGKLYVPDDGGKLYCFNAKTGKQLWKYSYGTNARGAPLIADGKIYITETNAKFSIIKLNGDKEPDENEAHVTIFKNKPGAPGFVEMNSTPSLVDGRIYFGNRDEIFCIAKDGGKPTPPVSNAGAAEPEAGAEDAIAQLQIYPADLVAKAGDTLEFEVRAYNAKGQHLKNAKVSGKWSLPQPPLPKGATTAPPPLDGTIDEATGKVVLNPKKPAQHGYVSITVGTVTGRARVRVAPQIPYVQNFEMIPENVAPSGWVNTQGKYFVIEEMDNGVKTKILKKVNNDARPPFARANAYITTPDVTNYTIESDVKGVEVRGKLPDAGLIGNRYTFYLDGKTDEKGNREVRVVSWEALPRINEAAPFTWKSGVWYRMKLSVNVGEKEAIVRCKVWERGQAEPEKWTIEFKDPLPNREGAAALYGYVTNATTTEPGAEIYYDNVKIAPNGK